MLRGTFLPAQTDCSTYPFSRLEQPRTLLEMGNYLGSRGVAGAGRPRPSDAIAGPAPLLHDSHASGGGRLTEALIEVGENYSVGPTGFKMRPNVVRVSRTAALGCP